MSRCYFYVVDRDFGFAPNPFHGSCSLATCKPGIRARARLDDWVIGMGGARLRATGRCIFAMQVTDVLSFNEYWDSADFLDKRPVRNGTRKMMVGDNIYHRTKAGVWRQADSHHSHPDGSANHDNILNDTKVDRVLLSKHFYYFGNSAPIVPEAILNGLNYKNGRSYRIYDMAEAASLIAWLERNWARSRNCVLGDPFDFEASAKRYSATDNRIR